MHENHEQTNETDEQVFTDEFDEQLRKTAQEMRAALQPDAEVLAKTHAVAHTTATAPTPTVMSLPVTPAAQAPSQGTKQRRRSRTLGVLAAAAAVVLVAVGGFAVVTNLSVPPLNTQSSATVATDIFTPSSYDELFESLDARIFSASPLMTEDAAVPNVTAPEDSASSAEGSTATPESSAPLAAPDSSAPATGERLDTLDNGGSYSETNTQVAGVDESDIVKTDGKNIYSLYGNDIIIAAAKGEDTRELSRVTVEAGYVQDMYLSGNRLVVISQSDEVRMSSYYETVSCVTLYDIGDPSSPELIEVFGQDGTLRDTRLVDNTLTVVSVYTLYGGTYDQVEPRTFVPVIYDGVETTVFGETNSNSQPLAVEDIRVMPEYSSGQYTVVATLDINRGERVDELSFLGDAGTVYMNQRNLYLAATDYGYSNVATLTEPTARERSLRAIPIFPWDIFSFIVDPDSWYVYDEPVLDSDVSSSMVMAPSTPTTRIVRIAFDNGSLEYAASTTIDGVLLNQFSLDEFGGYLRVATTVTITSQTGGSSDVSGVWDGTITTTTNSLLVLDENLTTVGSIEDMAPGERIYSARFTGDVGYMVTFRQTDPLFSLDLSDPRNPRVMDALKIPGFSQYLHLYADGLLLGLGQNTSSNGSLTGNLKLSMFDVSNPFDISEAHKQLIEAHSSDALYNHKALLIDGEKNIIGFAADSEYAVEEGELLNFTTIKTYYIFGYSDSEGFYERAAITVPDAYEEVRALYIDNYLYIVNGENIGVLALDTFEEITWITM